MSIAYELGDFQSKEEGFIPFHLNLFRGITWGQVREIQRRRLEIDQNITEVEPIQSSAEVVALSGLSALPDQQEAA
jgi:hypothetical protein